MVKRTWVALDGCLVLDILINRDPRGIEPSTATVRCRSGADEQVVVIYATQASTFDLKFRSGCYIQGQMQQRNNVHVDGVDSTGIFADIWFGLNGRYDDTHFEGLMVACPTRNAPPTPPFPPIPPDPYPDDPSQPGSPIPIVTGSLDELFPYVYVRRWPKVSEEDLRYGFIQYAQASPPYSTFFADLVAARQQGRGAAEALALQFIDGDPPYQGQFIGNLGALTGPVRDFARLAEMLRQRDPGEEGWLDLLAEEVAALLVLHDLEVGYFNGVDYPALIGCIWQSYFALVVTLGYDPALLDELGLCLWLAHFIEQAVTVDADGDLVLVDLTLEQLAELAGATVILPDSVFPLPPAPGPGPNPPPEMFSFPGWIEPYAIGDLQMVRQRLVRYAAGEIARIENIIRGERKEISSRRKRRQLDVEEHASSEDQVLRNDDADTRTNLLEEARRTVAEKSITNAYDGFQSSYGPPTQATLNGSWTRTTLGGAPGFNDVTRFARNILTKTVSRITRKVGVIRSSSTLSQVEDTVSSVIDNTAGQTNVRAVFRWLNKVYEASVVNYGNRLMIEFVVRLPASAYLAQQSTLSGLHLLKPTAPGEMFGINSFKDITPDNYAFLCAFYSVTELQPPPLAQRFATTTLRGGEEKQIAIPAGYCAQSALARALSTTGGLAPPQVMVGCNILTPDGVAVALQPYAEDMTIPVAATGYEATLSPPADPEALVNVEVQCAPTARAMDQWRIGVYGAVIRAYNAATERYFNQTLSVGQPGRNPLANRQIEQRALKKACIELLLERASQLTGGETPAFGSPPSPGQAYQPHDVQFLDAALEWGEMAYTFRVDANPQPGDAMTGTGPLGVSDDALFDSFLQAIEARVLAPVRPDRLMAFLYYFSAGMLWEGADSLIAVNPDEVALVNDLKHSPPEDSPQTIGPSWEVVVPTSMQILDEVGSGLPAVAGAGQ